MENWIDVNDRLPEFTDSSENLKWSDDVIGYVIRTNEKPLICFVYYANIEGWCYSYGESLFKNDIITHWMPLPSAPAKTLNEK